MKTTKAEQITARTDDGLIEAIIDIDNEGDVTVCASLKGDSTPLFEDLDAETLERLAALVESVRRDRGDMRSVCVEHGLHHYDYSGRGRGCPKCSAEASDSDKAALAAEVRQ